jgi:hypothetical protein
MTEKHEKSLTDRQKQALPFFIGCKSYEEGCRNAGVSKHAFYTWLQNPAFKAELARLQDEVVVDAVQTLKYSMTRATGVLVSLLDNKDNPSLLRSVCNDIIGHVSKFREIERRLEVLESNANFNSTSGK